MGIRDGLPLEFGGCCDAAVDRPHVTSKDAFITTCSMKWNTKCARCRACLVDGELHWIPLVQFTEGQWLRGGKPLLKAATLAPGWDKPSDTVCGCMYTRARLVDNTICYGCCRACADYPTKSPFHSVQWPPEGKFRAAGEEGFPSNNNLPHLQVVRLYDRFVSGARVNIREGDALGNARFHTMQLEGDRRGLSTQLVSFWPPTDDAWHYFTATLGQRTCFEEAVLINRLDLRQHYEKQFEPFRGAASGWKYNSSMASAASFVYSDQESAAIEQLQTCRTPPPSAVPLPSNRHQPCGGPAGWLVPLHLPPTADGGAFTAMVHLIMGVPLTRETFMQTAVLDASDDEKALKECLRDLWAGKRPATGRYRRLSRLGCDNAIEGFAALAKKVYEGSALGVSQRNGNSNALLDIIIHVHGPLGRYSSHDCCDSSDILRTYLDKCAANPKARLTDTIILRWRPRVKTTLQALDVVAGRRLEAIMFRRTEGDAPGWTTVQKGVNLRGSRVWFSCYQNYVDEMNTRILPLDLERNADVLLVYSKKQVST